MKCDPQTMAEMKGHITIRNTDDAFLITLTRIDARASSYHNHVGPRRWRSNVLLPNRPLQLDRWIIGLVTRTEDK